GCSLEKTQKSSNSWFLNHELLNKDHGHLEFMHLEEKQKLEG
ncbi:unnamed protein product, partial [Linum tenue]